MLKIPREQNPRQRRTSRRAHTNCESGFRPQRTPTKELPWERNPLHWRTSRPAAGKRRTRLRARAALRPGCAAPSGEGGRGMPTKDFSGSRGGRILGPFGKWKIKTEQEFPGYRAPRWGSSEPHLSPTWEQEITGIRSKKVPGGGTFSRKKVFPGESHISL